jgi:archaellum component FlaC
MNKEEYITKEYLDKTLDKKIELLIVRFERHVTDLASGFNEKLKGVCDQVASIDEKLTVLDQKVTGIDSKLTRVGLDVFNIDETLKEKTDKKETLDLKKRVIRLELKDRV